MDWGNRKRGTARWWRSLVLQAEPQRSQSQARQRGTVHTGAGPGSAHSCRQSRHPPGGQTKDAAGPGMEWGAWDSSHAPGGDRQTLS